VRAAHRPADIATHFQAMASPCVALIDTEDTALGMRVGERVRAEALRVEAKYSRYRPSVITSINENAGRDTEVDVETADLIDYAASCHELSGGRFDVTSGVLRRVWRFDGSGAVPEQAQIDEVMALVGWDRVSWRRPWLRLAPGMQIDLGGIGKEYAADRAMRLAQQEARLPMLVNLGGDLSISGPRRDGSPWCVAIEDAERAGASAGLMELDRGALATSGDAYRSIVIDGVRYGHVLDARTGWPVRNAPRSVTVHAATCTEAGLLAKLALLRGPDAEDFLKENQVRAWCYR
jgi:thiamine biosynthesis lipoprotein